MSPEQISGDVEAVKACSDIYSVGVILYQLLTGVLPFSGPRNQVFIGHLCVPAPAFSEKNPDVHVPPVVEALVLRCLEKDPKKRPASARALAEEFHRIVAPLVGAASPDTDHWVRRDRAWMALVGVVGLGIGVLLLPRIRPASPTEFSVTADPSSMELIAGGEAQPVRLQFVGCKPGTNVEVSFPDPLADVAMKQVGTFFGDLYEFQVAADLNARPTPEPIALQLRIRAGADVRESSIRLRIVRPTIAPLPAGFHEAEGSQLRRLAINKIYPDRIVRRLSDRVDVVFLLIPVEPGHAGPAQSFYIMENKVWNELFDAYLKDKPEAARKLKDFDRRRAAWEREGGSWPLFNISSREAQEFAHWLVPSGRSS